MEGERSLHFHEVLFWTQVTFKTNKTGWQAFPWRPDGKYFRFASPVVSRTTQVAHCTLSTPSLKSNLHLPSEILQFYHFPYLNVN